MKRLHAQPNVFYGQMQGTFQNSHNHWREAKLGKTNYYGWLSKKNKYCFVILYPMWLYVSMCIMQKKNFMKDRSFVIEYICLPIPLLWCVFSLQWSGATWWISESVSYCRFQIDLIRPTYSHNRRTGLSIIYCIKLQHLGYSYFRG